ncbi:hypothetical protein MTO96_010092 [Rhipicephalus appendiculatus]|uniref:Uncharacterized protein n=1 Tax=Rhipicephalus zambeziensis TaxID=60191 RepID=A0A224YCV1_9ACAR
MVLAPLTADMDDGSAPLHCRSTLYLDVTLEELNRGFERLVADSGADERLAREISRHFRSRFRDLVYGNVVVDERGPTGSLTLEELLEDKLREVAHLRATVPAELRRKHERALAELCGRPPDGEKTDPKG